MTMPILDFGLSCGTLRERLLSETLQACFPVGVRSVERFGIKQKHQM